MAGLELPQYLGKMAQEEKVTVEEVIANKLK
jgi:hypothetical protein